MSLSTFTTKSTNSQTSQWSGRDSRRHRRTRRRRITVIVLAGMVATCAAITTTIYIYARNLPGTIRRIDGVFASLEENQRPPKAVEAKGSMTFLLVGSDSQDPTTGSDSGEPELAPGGQRSDVMMVVHLPASKDNATIISIPRDSWVTIPGRGDAKLNAAYAWGGPSLLVHTIEQLTAIRIDHFAIVDFYGFKGIVDAVDGVDVPMAHETTIEGTYFPEGINHLNGDQALAYVRERKSLPNGDLDRVKRQQNMIRAIVARISTFNPMRDPVTTYGLMNTGLKSISVDSTLDNDKLRELATAMMGMKGGDLSFLTSPVKALGREGSQSVVYLDDARCADLWTAIRSDTISDYLAAHRGDLLTTVPQ